MVAELEVLAGRLEGDKDVKCWTSFKQLETFIAGCQLDPRTTHLKVAAVKSYVDHVWKEAATHTKDVISREELDATVSRIFPHTSLELVRFTVQLGTITVTVPFHDVTNYEDTVEPLRLLQTLAKEVQAQSPERPALTMGAIESARHLIALLSTALLREAAEIARARRHASIEAEDLLEVDRRLAAELGIARIDPDRAPENIRANTESPRDAMLAVARAKIGALAEFNTRYSAEKLERTFDADLALLESEWATRPVEPEASSLHKQALVSLARFLHTTCARANQSDAVLSGTQMLATIEAHYPSVTTWAGIINLFPNEPVLNDVWVAEYQADALRDSAWHWRAIERSLVGQDERVRELDLYAMEELSEFLSVYAVALLMVAGNVAENTGRDTVGVDELRAAQRAFRLTRRNLVAKDNKTLPASPPADPERARSALESQLRAAYIDQVFTDRTERSGIDFVHETSRRITDYRFGEVSEGVTQSYLDTAREKQLDRDKGVRIPNLEIGIAGGGVAVADVDGDGLLDIYLVSGGRDRLYRNLGDLRFIDVTDDSRLVDGGEGRGAYFVDYDNDGDQDLFVTHVYSPNRLYRNRGDGTFEDVTEASRLPLDDDRISHSATWFDYDGDGNLDLYVGDFGDWLGGDRPFLAADSRNGGRDRLYRNTGDGRFHNVTLETNAGRTGWTQAVSHFDANGDGWQDIYVCNDFGSDELLINEAGRGFVNETPPGIKNRFLHGMSVGFTDANGDGVDDIYVSNIAIFSFVSKYITPGAETQIVLSQHTALNARIIEANMFLVSDGSSYSEAHNDYFDRVSGCGWAWDADFFDFDNDGHEDLYVVNGREPNLTYDRERNVLFKQVDGQFYDVSVNSGADIRSNSRGAVHADLDRDGDLDLIVNCYESGAILLSNNTQRRHWVRLELEGSLSNRDAIGARVELRAGGRVQRRTIRGGSGFLSKEPCELHFGLGAAESVEEVVITWPSGGRQVLTDLAINRAHEIVESEMVGPETAGR